MSAQSESFCDACPCIEACCLSCELVHGSLGQGELFTGVLFPLLVEFEATLPGALSLF